MDDGACALVGYSGAELLQLHGSELVLPEDRPAVATSVDRMRRGTLEWRQGRLVHKDGSVVPIEVSARPLEEGRVELKVRALKG